MNTKLEAARGRLILSSRHVSVEKRLVDSFLKHGAEHHTDPRTLHSCCRLSFDTLASWVESKALAVHDVQRAQEIEREKERKQEFQQAQISLFRGGE